MARNKYPEETRKKILDVAQNLFYEKGYERTSIQDIINGLNGLTKGVIYHHFKSKKDIFQAVMDRIGLSDEQPNWYDNWEGDTGIEKIRQQIMKSLKNFERYAILYSAEVLLQSPQMLGELYLSSINEEADYLRVYIDEGIQDGSINTPYPKELAEFISITVNIWVGLKIAKYSRKELENKLLFLKCAFMGVNVPLIDDEMVDAFLQLQEHIHSRR